MKRFLMQFLVVVLLLGAAGQALPQSPPQISARLEPQEIEVGNLSALTVTVSGVTSAQVSVPDVPGLKIIYAGQQSNFSMINGQTSRQLSIIYHVRAMQEGDYTIPPISVSEGGQDAHSDPVQLHVTGGLSSNVAPSPAQNRSQQLQQQLAAITTAARAATSAQQADEPTRDNNPQTDAIFVRLTAPKKIVYVGELVPIQIKLYVRNDAPAKLRSLPSLAGDAFAMNKLPAEPLQAVENIDGMPYQTATWNTALSAVKSGEYPVQVEVGLTVLQRQARHGGAFDDPFFALFSSSVKQVDQTYANEAETWRAQPLPSEGKPASFSGAIGEFKLSAQADPSQAMVGDPVTLRLTVEGRGNFNAVNPPQLENVDGWKTYTAGGKTEVSDPCGISGKKVFEEAIIPKKTALSMPKAVFSWFSPEAKQYITREVVPPQVTIVDAPPGSVAAASRPNPGAAKPIVDDTKKDADTLVANKVEMGPFSPTFKPQILNPGLVISQALTLAALIVALFTARRRHLLENNPDYARAVKMDRRLRETLEAMHRTAVTKNSALFFSLARTALQLRLGDKWKIKPEDITYAIVEERAPIMAKSLQMIFHLADELAYSGGTNRNLDLGEWERTVRSELQKMDHLS
jgi:hypothetical protein